MRYSEAAVMDDFLGLLPLNSSAYRPTVCCFTVVLLSGLSRIYEMQVLMLGVDRDFDKKSK